MLWPHSFSLKLILILIPIRTLFLKHLALFAVLFFSSFVTAQPSGTAWPSKPIKLVIPYAAGGPADVVGRELARQLTQLLSQAVVVENQGGGMGLPALTAVTRAEPDGHTLLMLW
jgi:tripartite-type tricarboxylate transporter receptor subunit TctC